MKKELIFVEERKRDILEYVVSKKKATVAELCARFGVSSATIRNDLRDLEENAALVRTHGGAIVRDQARFEPDAVEKAPQHIDEKHAIATVALRCIEDGDTIVIDTGTTTLELAKLLNAKKNIAVITNDLAIATILEEHPSATVYFLGGTLRKRFHCTIGARAEEGLRGLTVDKAFMAANSFSIEKGAATPDIQLADLKKTMMSIATKVYLLIDSSKMGKNSFARFAGPEEIDCLVIDMISAEDAKSLEDIGVEILTVASDKQENQGD
jgi:DeoR family fructose operon transcriptional repressor